MRNFFCSLWIFTIIIKTIFFIQHFISKVFEKIMILATKVLAWWEKISTCCKNLHPWFCSLEKPYFCKWGLPFKHDRDSFIFEEKRRCDLGSTILFGAKEKKQFWAKLMGQVRSIKLVTLNNFFENCGPKHFHLWFRHMYNILIYVMHLDYFQFHTYSQRWLQPLSVTLNFW